MKTLCFIFLIAIITFGCGESKNPVVVSAGDEVLQGTVLGEPIIYDMIIRNANPDDEWAEECLRNLDRNKLISIIFDAVYQESLVPYDFYTHQPISLSELRKLENNNEFSREKIGKLQFEEEWSFDEPTLQLRKKVNSILLAYEVYNSAGELRGYKPAFYVKLN